MFIVTEYAALAHRIKMVRNSWIYQYKRLKMPNRYKNVSTKNGMHRANHSFKERHNV